jgi:hypothetical protein
MTDAASAQLPVTANFINPETMHRPGWRPRSGVNGLGRRLSMVMLCGGRDGLVDHLLGNGRVEELAA